MDTTKNGCKIGGFVCVAHKTSDLQQTEKEAIRSDHETGGLAKRWEI